MIWTPMSRLRILRKEHRISLADLAAKVGCTDKTLREYEIGRTLPNVQVAMRIADALGCSVYYLWGPESKRPTT